MKELDDLKNMVEKLHELQTTEQKCVKLARQNGATWEQIAEIYGVSRQAVHSKWAERIK